jgi:hypothetical protein
MAHALCLNRRQGSVSQLPNPGTAMVWTECGGDVGCRKLDGNGLTGPLPTELGNMEALRQLCVRRPHSPRLDA